MRARTVVDVAHARAQHALLVGASIAGSIGGTAGGAHLNLEDDIVGLGALGGRSSHRLHRSERLGHMHAGHGRVQTCALTSSVCARARTHLVPADATPAEAHWGRRD